jgi:hypothetical protein
MPDATRSYYSIVRVDKPDAFPVNALMIRALELEGAETAEGVLRYTNTQGNVVMEVLGRNSRQPYGQGSNDLLKPQRLSVLQVPSNARLSRISASSISH